MADIAFISFALRRVYCAMAGRRCNKGSLYRKNMPDELVEDVAKRLGNVKLVRLFVEAQFKCMPSEFCKEHFNRSYPPPNVVFGGGCWKRYSWYVERGIRDGC